MSKYDDIIDLPYSGVPGREHMPVSDRAAQFAPFAALSGYEDVIDNTGRLTSPRITLSGDELEQLNRTLCRLAADIKNCPQVTITYFVPDGQKEGGEYITVRSGLAAINRAAGTLTLSSGTVIPLRDIVGAEQ